MSFSFLDVLLIIGITQGAVTASLLLISKERKVSNLLLALAILSFCLLSFKVLLNFMGISGASAFRYIPNATELAIAPLFYFYLVALTTKGFKVNLKLLGHFIPFIIAQLYAFLIYWQAWGYPTKELQDLAVQELFYTFIKRIEDFLIVASIFIYLYLSSKKILIFQKQVRDRTADSTYPTLSWLKNNFILSTILFLFLILNMSLDAMIDLDSKTELHWRLYFVYLAGIIYYLGFLGYRQKAPDLDQIFDIDVKSDNGSENTKISAHKAAQITESVQHLLKVDKIFLEPTLNARQVSERLKVSQTNLSLVINKHFQRSFRDLINEHRIDDVKKKLLDADNKASILSVALDSGFNSEASFYRVFKKKTGMSPKEFISQQA